MSNEMLDWIFENEQTRSILNNEIDRIVLLSRMSLPNNLFNELVEFKNTTDSLLSAWTPLNEDVKNIILSNIERIMQQIQWVDLKTTYEELKKLKEIMKTLL